jgi:hypothetical protein
VDPVESDRPLGADIERLADGRWLHEGWLDGTE